MHHDPPSQADGVVEVALQAKEDVLHGQVVAATEDKAAEQYNLGITVYSRVGVKIGGVPSCIVLF